MDEQTPEQLVEQLKRALPDALRCVVLYGSAAAGDFIPGVSNYNLLVIADPLGPAELTALMPAINGWMTHRREAPLLFTTEQFRRSGDAFPIEFLDIQQSRRVLFGEDLAAHLKIDRNNLRLELERELKGKLLALRRDYLRTKGQAHEVAALLTHSLSTFLVLFRASLRLFESDVPARKLEALERLKQHIAFDAKPFLELHEIKERRGPVPSSPESLFAAYLKEIETIVEAVDRLVHPET